MDIVLSPSQQDRLVETLLDPGLAGYGRATATPGPGVTRDAVQDAWQRLGAALPTARLRLESGAAALADRVTPVELLPDGAQAPEPGAGALCRVYVRETAAGEVGQIVVAHSRLALDGHAAAVLAGEIARLAGGADPRPVPDVTDYRDRLDGGAAATRYWQDAVRELDGPTPLFDEPRDLPRPEVVVRRELPAEVAGAADTAAQALGVSSSWLLLAAWGVVAARFRGGERSAIGVALDTRPAGLEDAVGVFETTLPLVVGLDRRPLRDWLPDQAEAVRRLFAAAHVTRAARNEAAGTSRTKELFDSVVDLRPGAHGFVPGPGVPFTLRRSGNELVADVDEAVVPLAQAGRLLAAVEVALGALAAGNGSTAEISLLDAGGEVAVRAHNDTVADYPDEATLHGLVEEQVRRSPDAVALVFEDETLTYAELNVRANRLAHDLIGRGVRPDDIVGLCAEPGIAQVVAILGILKAGGAYAPLDPFFPPERLEYLYGDLDCQIVLVEEHLARLLPDEPGRNVLLTVPEAGDPGHDRDPVVDVACDNLAYVMYTSGSTGRPKGVLIQHGGSVNFVTWMTRRFELRPDQAALQWTAYSFDAAVWELFWPLMVGARAVVAPGKIHLDLTRFVDLIARTEVATLHFVPAMLQTFLSAPDVERCTSLRNVFVSGEPVPVSLMRRFHDRLDADLINLYGVTEVSIDSTYYVCPRGDDLPFVRSGTPLSNTRTYVLDENLAPVPFGARGEVYIAGDSVTRGYLGRRGLSADRFIPDPFAAEVGRSGARMYRSGDIALLLPDGNLHFLGRGDDQVKIRGIRVELLEVAAEFNAHPALRESLVVPHGEGADRGLAAYVIAEEGQALDVGELRAFVAGRMPPYMVPNAIIVLEEFPLNANGKVDRPKLPDPATEISQRRAGRPPEGELEQAIAEIWRRMLELDTVGADEEFFAIGGNSLLATRVIAEVRSTFDTRLSLREWLEASTIEQLAEAIERSRSTDDLANQLLDEVELGVG